MRIFYDTEFHERGSRTSIEFISIGMVREDDAEYYAISTDVQWWAVVKNEWLRDNVLTQLPGQIKSWGNGGGDFYPDLSTGLYKSRTEIARDVSAFTSVGLSKGQRAELWAYYADYDHVVLAQLFGRMIDLPAHMPMYTRDFKQATDMLMPDHRWPKQEGDEHNALADARWLRDRFTDMVKELPAQCHRWVAL